MASVCKRLVLRIKVTTICSDTLDSRRDLVFYFLGAKPKDNPQPLPKQSKHKIN
jgi:hypothetical protein